MSEICRCGWNPQESLPHLCHRCHQREGSRRLYHEPGPIRYSLAGMQPKLSLCETHGCDECWAEMQKVLEQVKAGADVPPNWRG
jgi:hypothetical protein